MTMSNTLAHVFQTKFSKDFSKLGVYVELMDSCQGAAVHSLLTLPLIMPGIFL